MRNQNKESISNKASKKTSNKTRNRTSNKANSKEDNNKKNIGRINNTKSRKRPKDNSNKHEEMDTNLAYDSSQIINVAYVIIGLFILIIGFFSFSMVTKSEDIVNNPYNKRQDMLAEQIVRGSILSSDGKTLAHTKENEDGTETRVYPYGDLFAHSVGRFSKSRTGIEFNENFRLLTSNTNGLTKLFMDFTGQKNLGDDVVSTLDYDLQKAAYDGLGNNKGAIVVMEPSSGKILASVSKPSYDPNNIDSIWDNVKDDNTNKPLMNRATSEAYPPGSIFKVVTTLEFIRQNPNYESYTYECNGTYSDGIVKVGCVRSHGVVNLKESLAQSCNGSFANIAENLNSNKFKETVASLNLDTYLPEGLDYNHPHTAIGQGDVKVSPMQMAEFASGIANGGIAMKPYITDHIVNSDGNVVKKFTPEINNRFISTKEAEILTDLMEEVVNSGTATNLQSSLYTVAGKTGTAQNQTGNNDHSWFIGFANTDNPEIVVSIIVENASSNTKRATGIAKDIFDTYFNKQD